MVGYGGIDARELEPKALFQAALLNVSSANNLHVLAPSLAAQAQMNIRSQTRPTGLLCLCLRTNA
eukprot:6663515-Pyramimonas_sp.AAC.1